MHQNQQFRAKKAARPAITKEQVITEQEKEAFIAEDENEKDMDIAMRLRIRKMRDNEKLDAMHSKRSYRI